MLHSIAVEKQKNSFIIRAIIPFVVIYFSGIGRTVLVEGFGKLVENAWSIFIIGTGLYFIVVSIASLYFRSHSAYWKALASGHLIALFILIFAINVNDSYVYLLMISVLYASGVLFGESGVKYATVSVISTVVICLIISYFNYGKDEFRLADIYDLPFMFVILLTNAYLALTYFQKSSSRVNGGLIMNGSAVEDSDKQIENLQYKAEIGSLTQSLLHDLKTPVSSIRIALEMIKGVKYSPELVGEALIAQEKLESIIKDTEVLIESTKMYEHFNIRQEVERIVRISQAVANRSMTQIIVKSIPEVSLYGRRNIFSRIILNIITNSLDALQKVEGEREVFVEGSMEEEFVLIKIKDSGEGISREVMKKVFEARFSTYKKTHSGLGLPYVKKAIDEHFNGTVQIKSRVGQGTTVILRFRIND